MCVCSGTVHLLLTITATTAQEVEDGLAPPPSRTAIPCTQDEMRTLMRRYVSQQWNLSNPDTNGAEESVIVSEVSSFQRLKCMQEWYLGWEKVSCLERCPQFRSVNNVYQCSIIFSLVPSAVAD